MAVNLSIRGLWKTCLWFICTSRPYWKLSQMPTSKGVAQCCQYSKPQPPCLPGLLQLPPRDCGTDCWVRSEVLQTSARAGEAPSHTRVWHWGFSCLSHATQSRPGCVLPCSALYTMVCSLCFPGVQHSSPHALEGISGAPGLGKGFLELFLPYFHHGSDGSVTSSSCQHLS